MEAELKERIRKLQLLEESLNANLQQKQQAQAHLMELESAKEALGGASQAYRIIGNLMVERPAARLSEELEEQMERSRVRIAALEKQEAQAKEKAEGLQQEIMQGMKEGS